MPIRAIKIVGFHHALVRTPLAVCPSVRPTDYSPVHAGFKKTKKQASKTKNESEESQASRALIEQSI